MNIVAVAIEYILTGLLTLCAFVLPFLGHRYLSIERLSNGEIVGVLGLAYLLGVIFDRVTDTVLGAFEQWERLRIAGRRFEKLSLKPLARSDEEDRDDPFPQERLEFELREKGTGLLEWMEALRSRIRVARGLTMLGMPAALGTVVFLQKPEAGDFFSVYICSYGAQVFIGLNLLLLGYSAYSATLKRDGDWREKRVLPKTNELCLFNPDEDQELNAILTIRTLPFRLLYVSSVLGIVLSICADWSNARKGPMLIAVAGPAVSLLAFWSWQRITRTYLEFILRQRHYRDSSQTAECGARSAADHGKV